MKWYFLGSRWREDRLDIHVRATQGLSGEKRDRAGNALSPLRNYRKGMPATKITKSGKSIPSYQLDAAG